MASCPSCGQKVGLRRRLCGTCQAADAVEKRAEQEREESERRLLASIVAAGKRAERERERQDRGGRRLASIEVSFDEFDQRYSVVSPTYKTAFTMSGRYRLEGTVEWKACSEFGKDGSSVLTCLLFVRVGDSWAWMSDDKTIGLAHGQPHDLRVTGQDSVLDNGDLLEIRTVFLEPADLEAWYTSLAVRLKIGSWETDISKEMLEWLRAIELKRSSLLAS